MQATKKLFHLNDDFLKQVKNNWYSLAQKPVLHKEFVPIADAWFKSSSLCRLHGWPQFDQIDVILGCTHYIESLISRYGIHGLQVLPYEYNYWNLMGRWGTEPGNLTPGVPLVVSLPNWFAADIRQDWPQVLRECEAKKIPIHIDMAWLVAGRDIELDLDHPNIESFAMSISKLGMEWNRIGLRYTKKRTVDSITIFNYYNPEVNSALTSAGAYIMSQVPRDYAWQAHGHNHIEVCKQLGLEPTKMIHVARDPSQTEPVGIGQILSGMTPNSIQ